MYSWLIRKNRGAVSIFLAIILLPTISFIGLFTDLARVELSKETAVTAAELLMNTVLTQYDAKLKDSYGLFASKNELDAATCEDYFKACLKSAGVSTDDAAQYVSNIMDVFVKQEGIADFLQITEKNFTFGPAPNGTMSNPGIMKSQVVDFMKYRAPINAAASFFEKLANSDEVKEIDNLGAETKMIEAREDFYEAEEALVKAAKSAYEAIETYEKKAMASKEALEQLEKDYKSLSRNGSDLENVYRDAHNKLVKNLYTTHNSEGTLKTFITKKYITTQYTVTTYTENSKAKADKVKERLTDMSNKINTYVNASNDLVNAWNNFTKYNSSTHYGIQYWLKLTNSIKSKYEAYVTAASNLCYSFARLENAVTYCEDDVMETEMVLTNKNVPELTSTTEKSTYQEIYDALEKKYNSLYSTISAGGISQKRSIDTTIGYLNTQNNKNAMKINTVNDIYSIRNQLNTYKTKLNETKKAADTAKTKVDALTEKVKAYNSAYNDWIKAASNSELNDCETATARASASNNYFSGDRELIENLDTSLMDAITEESVSQLSGRLANISTIMNTLSTAISKITYKGTPIVDIGTYASFYSASKLDASQISIVTNSLNQYAESSFDMDDGSGLGDISFVNDNSTDYLKNATTLNGKQYVSGYKISKLYHPEFKVTKEPLYTWMVEKFTNGDPVPPNSYVNDESSANSWDSTISGKKDSEGSATDTSGNTSASKNEIKDAVNLVSSGGGDDFNLTDQLSKVSDFVGGLFTDFSGTFGTALKGVRDDIFTIDYIMSMFTYDTFDSEGKFSQLTEQQQDTAISKRSDAEFASVSNKWNSSNDKKSLTMLDRNDKNNYSYLNEVEYILYGGTNTSNKAGTYGRIYLIRYAVNLAPVLKVWYNHGTVNLIAQAIQALIYIPAPLTKTLICLGITAAEAAMDLSTIKKGIPLVLIKRESDLVCSFASVFEGGSGNSAVASGKSRLMLQYSHYLYLLLFLKLQTHEESVYKRLADTVQANVRLQKGETVTDAGSFSMNNAVVYFNLSVDVQVEPFLSEILMFSEAGDALSAEGWRTYKISMTRGY